MCIISSLLAIFIFVISSGLALAQQKSWELDGSTVQLVAQGSTIRLIFQSTSGLFSLQGANSGSVLFEGRRDGQTLTGTAYAFSAGCLPEGYEAKGVIAADGNSVRLSGRVPARDPSCVVKSYSEQTLALATPQARPVAPLPSPTPTTPPAAWPTPSNLPTPTPTPVATATPETLQPNGPTLWRHNGSILYLVATGKTREFHYERPRSELVAAGAQKGSIVFAGEWDRTSNSYAGTAFVFKGRCGQRSYSVTGPVSSDMRRVTMTGQAPRLDGNCKVTGYSADSLVFDLIDR